jgi:hypothetical protein
MDFCYNELNDIEERERTSFEGICEGYEVDFWSSKF